MKKINFLFILTLQIVFLSCDKPRCENINPVYIENTIHSKVYNDALLKELSTEENLTFWLKDVKIENGKDYLIVNIFNKNVCIDGRFLIRDWGAIKGVEKNSYSNHKGAQLEGFQYSITYTSTETILNFKSLTTIIDLNFPEIG